MIQKSSSFTNLLKDNPKIQSKIKFSQQWQQQSLSYNGKFSDLIMATLVLDWNITLLKYCKDIVVMWI